MADIWDILAGGLKGGGHALRGLGEIEREKEREELEKKRVEEMLRIATAREDRESEEFAEGRTDRAAGLLSEFLSREELAKVRPEAEVAGGGETILSPDEAIAATQAKGVEVRPSETLPVPTGEEVLTGLPEDERGDQISALFEDSDVDFDKALGQAAAVLTGQETKRKQEKEDLVWAETARQAVSFGFDPFSEEGMEDYGDYMQWKREDEKETARLTKENLRSSIAARGLQMRQLRESLAGQDPAAIRNMSSTAMQDIHLTATRILAEQPDLAYKTAVQNAITEHVARQPTATRQHFYFVTGERLLHDIYRRDLSATDGVEDASSRWSRDLLMGTTTPTGGVM